MSYSIRFRALKVNPNRINVSLIEGEAMAYVRRFLDTLVAMLAQYPAAPANSKYRRTYELQKGWRVRVTRTASGIDGTITNDATSGTRGRKYMPYVQGGRSQQPHQTSLHAATGWKTGEELALSMRDEYRRGLQAIYSRGIRSAA